MNNEKILETGVAIGMSIVTALVIVAAASTIANGTMVLLGKGINKIDFNRKMRKGLKDGSIVKIDGKFYNVERTNEEA